MARHTPGPWHYAKQPHPHDRFQPLMGFAVYGGDATVADIFPQPYPVHVSEANARLIAAAPELLDAARQGADRMTDLIEEGRQTNDEHHPLYHAREVLRAAIAKAEGRS